MATTYEPAPDQAVRMLRGLVDEFRDDLGTHDVSICLLFAHSDDEHKPALKKGGQVLAGWCKVNSYQDRVQGKSDATICVDGDRWGRWSTQRQRALLHHELLHIAKYDGEKRDKLGRPAISARYGDWHFDRFFEVLKRYGDDSFEQSNLNAVAEGARQSELDFPEDDEGDDMAASTEAA